MAEEEVRVGRRGFLKKLVGRGAVAAAGATVASGLLADSAGAANGQAILIGTGATQTTQNTDTTTTTLTGSTFAVNGGSDATNLASLRGIAGSATTIGVAGASSAGPQLRAEPNPITAMPPTAGTWNAGSMMATTDPTTSTTHDLWYCYADGVGANSGWFPLSLIPAFIPLLNPQRIYNSATAGTGAPILNTEERSISALTGAFVPLTAFAVMFSLAVYNTVNTFGFLSVFPADQTWSGNSNINWFGSNQILATTVVTAIDATGHFKVHCGTNGSTHFVVDMIGYYTLTA